MAREAACIGRAARRSRGALRERPRRWCVTARARQLGACRNLRQAPDRAPIGIPVAAAAPAVATVIGGGLNLDGQLFLAASQSGGSDDLVESGPAGTASGALTVDD